MKYEYMKNIVKYLTNELPDNKTKEWLNYCKYIEELFNDIKADLAIEKLLENHVRLLIK